jgi:hypothetical protein
MKRLLYKNYGKLKKLNTLANQLNTYSALTFSVLNVKRKTYYLQCSITGSSKRIFLRGFAEKKFCDLIKSNYFPIKNYS